MMTNPSFTVNVALSVSEDTATLLRDLVDHLTAALFLVTGKAAEFRTPEQPSGEDDLPEAPEPAKAPEAPAAPAPTDDDDVIDVTAAPAPAKPKKAQKAASKAEPAPAPAPVAEVPNTALFAAVKDAQKRGADAPAIREIFNEFGIASSRDCPQERRADLLARLNALNA